VLELALAIQAVEPPQAGQGLGAHAPLPVVQLGTFAATQAGFPENVARSEAFRCFRCDAVYGCPSVTVVAGRGPHENVHPVPALSPAPAATQSIAGGDLQ